MTKLNNKYSLAELINNLDYKYQFVKNNRYWNYDQVYNLYLNDKLYQVSENDILLNISHNIANKVTKNFIQENDIQDYEVFNMDINQMKNIVVSFFMNINTNLKDKIELALLNTKFIKYDDNIPGNCQRSVTKKSGVTFYYKNDLSSLVTLAHEMSHVIANLDNNGKINNANKVAAFSEIESELAEDLFLEYLKNIHLPIKLKNSTDSVRNLNDNDINCIKYNKYKSVVFLSYRAIDELGFKKFIKSKGINKIDYELIHELSISMNITKENLISKIERFVNEYYPNENLLHDYAVKNYDLENGRHLSNESRFIYAFCFTEKFNEMQLDYIDKCKFYENYLENAKNMSFQDVLKLFNVDLIDLNRFSDEFINKFNELSNKSDFRYRNI